MKNNIKVIITGLPRTGTGFLALFVSKMGISLGDEKYYKNLMLIDSDMLSLSL